MCLAENSRWILNSKVQVLEMFSEDQWYLLWERMDTYMKTDLWQTPFTKVYLKTIPLWYPLIISPRIISQGSIPDHPNRRLAIWFFISPKFKSLILGFFITLSKQFWENHNPSVVGGLTLFLSLRSRDISLAYRLPGCLKKCPMVSHGLSWSSFIVLYGDGSKPSIYQLI